ncbi:MAG: LuxR C-terminal-related transcriptional regulator [Gaiellaceae bacterium]
MAGVADIGSTAATGHARTVTLLHSDFEDGPRLWAASPDAMSESAGMHREIVADAVSRHGGAWPADQREAGAVVASFPLPADAVAAALDVQREVSAREWRESLGARVRIALHTYRAPSDPGAEDMGFAVALSRSVRLRAIARGGQTVLSHVTHELVVDRLPDGAGLLNLGVHRLPDLGPPERVYELVHPGLPQDRPSLRSLDALPNNLPRELTSFIGRERELTEVRKVLDGVRLLTLTGPGGSGKTRLALQTAADAFGRFPDGIWLVELAPIEGPALVGQALGAAVGVRPLPGQSALDAAVSHLAGRRALILLDNCEHLSEGAAEVARALLERCPEVTVLATSRAPLGLAAETTWQVPSMTLPDSAEPGAAAALAQSDAVRLFVERATRVRPDFKVTAAAAPALAAVCSDLDGIPLALELAAARVRMLSIEQIAAGLSNRFHLLTGGDGGDLRHVTLRASVDWSHDLLSDQERTLLRRLGVFKGGFSLHAVEEVTALEPGEQVTVLDVLTALVDQSLVVAEDDGQEVRYRLLETVREYALDLLREADELDAVRDRHLDYFLSLAERTAPDLVGAGHRRSLAALDAEAANLAAALDRANARDADRGLRLCAALVIWWKQRGMFDEADAGCGRALEAADPEPSVVRALVLCGRAYLLTFAGRFIDAAKAAQEGLRVAEAVGDASTMSRSLSVLGTLRHGPDPAGSVPVYERACDLASEAEDHWCLAATTAGLGWSKIVLGELDEADRIFADCLPFVERMGYQEFVAWSLFGLGFRHGVEGRFEKFFELAERAVDAARDVGEPVTEGATQAVMGWFELCQGRIERALERLEASRARLIATGAGLTLPHAEIPLALARAEQGEIDEAIRSLRGVVAAGADGGWVLSWAMYDLADLLRVTGDTAAAQEQAQAALDVSERIGSAMRSAGALEVLARLAIERGDWSEAEALLQGALARRAELRLRIWLPQTLDALAEVATGLSRHEEAARLLAAAARGRSEYGLVRWAREQERCAALEDELHEALGGVAFKAAWREGAGLSLEDAVAWVRRGRGSRKRPRDGWESLTPTELEVARHAAGGRTNAEIGEAMFISRGTVKAHLSHIYAKLGVRNRAALTAEAAQRLPAARP